MKFILLILFTFSFANGLICQQFIALWPDSLPNSRGMDIQYSEERQRITQVAVPGIYCFRTSMEENSGAAVLICPPGGYQKLTYNLAGFQFAKWLNTIGVNAFVLIHRLPNSPDLIVREDGPIQDAQRAMKIIRGHAIDWKLDTNKIGIMGASAGGHLASTIGTHRDDFSNIGDSLDPHEFYPDFMILISPVITMGKYTHQGSLDNFLGEGPSEAMVTRYSNELQVSADTPPVFLVHAQNDNTVSSMNSMLFYQSILAHKVKGCSLHIFPEGGHSIALRNNPGSTNLWTSLCEEWLRETGFIR